MSRPRSRLRRLGWLGLTLLVPSCAHLPVCPQEGGPVWSEWRTTHFRIVTDLEAPKAEQTAQSFELVRDALVFAAWHREPDPPLPIDVVVLSSRAAMLAVLPAYVEGAFISPEPWHDGLVLLSGTTPLEGSETVKHELVHALAWRFGLRNAPPWLMEGLAVYLSTTHFADGGRRVAYGDAHMRSLRTLANTGTLDFDELWRRPDLADSACFYATSWLLVHYLYNHRADAFRIYQTRLSSGKAPRALWDEVFPGWSADSVSADLNAYLDGGNFYRYHAEFAPSAPIIKSKVLSHAAVHGWRALLFGLASAHANRRDETLALAAQEASTALTADPFELQATLIQRLLLRQNTDDLVGARRLVEHHSRSPRAWLVLGQALLAAHQDAEANVALTRAAAMIEADIGGAKPGAIRPAQPHE